MPGKTATKKNTAIKQGGTKSRASSQRRRGTERRSMPEGPQAVQGVYASRIEAEDALKDLYRAGFSKSEVSVRPATKGGDHQDVFQTAARLTGGALALSSMLIGAPAILMMQAVGFGRILQPAAAPVLVRVNLGDRRHTAKKADAVLRTSGSENVQVLHTGSDLTKREYRDATGELHHHTRTYLRDHAGELRRAA